MGSVEERLNSNDELIEKLTERIDRMEKQSDHNYKRENAKKLIVVLGATGHQGGSVLSQLVKEGYKVHAVTRDPKGDKAKKVHHHHHVEMVQGDVSAKSAEQDFTKIFHGAYGVYIVTNFWDPSSMGKEEQQGKAVLNAARNAGVEHVIYSGLPNVEEETKGKYNVPHFTDKAKVNTYAQTLKFKYYHEFAPAFYMQNFRNFEMAKMENGVMHFSMPETSNLTMIDIEDTGAIVAHLFRHPEKMNYEMVPACGDSLTPEEVRSQYEEVTGKPAKLTLIPRETYAKMKVPNAKEMADMYSYFNDYKYYGSNQKNCNKIYCVYPMVKTWKQYVATHNGI